MLEKDLSFIVQGPTRGANFEKYAQLSCESIRSFFPEATIILSTWEGQETEGINFDKLVLSKDPGAEVVIDSSQTLNNVNRQIVSTFAGICKSNTKYSVKIRSDLIFNNDNLVNILSQRPTKYDKFPEDILDEYVVVSNVTSINPNVSLILPHHPCDWIYAGLTKDLHKIWDIDLMPKNWFRFYSNNSWPEKTWHEKNYLSLFRPESYIWSSFLKKHREINFMNSFDSSETNLSSSYKYIALNLMIQTNKSIGIESLKNRISMITLIPSYTEHEWKKMVQSFGRKVDVSNQEYEHLIMLLFRKFRNPLDFYVKTKSGTLTWLSSIKRKLIESKDK